MNREIGARNDREKVQAYAGEVTTLEHEVGDDTVEGAALVAEAVLAGRELAEVARGHRDNIVVELEDNTTHRFVVSSDVKLQYDTSISVRDIRQTAARTKTLALHPR